MFKRIVCFTALFLPAVCLPLLAQRGIIRTKADLVVVPAFVRDANGRFVYDLAKEDFTVLESGRQQDVVGFSIDPAPLPAAVSK
jgi:hypothetical protein